MAMDDLPSTTPTELAEELARLLDDHTGTSGVTVSSDDAGAIVICYAYRDYAEEVATLAENSGFEVAHRHRSGDEVHFTFGYPG